MKHMTLGILGISCAVLFTAGVSLAADDLKVGSTLENLQAAYNGESNAHARYLAFATKADQEGNQGVASLFRAASKSEEVHAAHHAKVIEGMGAKPTALIAAPDVKSTLQNLQAALTGESYERDVIYPAFVKKAQEEGNHKAVKVFTWALKAEVGHAKLYAEAIANIDSWRSTKREFVICPQCGYTAPVQAGFNKCPICSEPRKKFMLIS